LTLLPEGIQYYTLTPAIPPRVRKGFFPFSFAFLFLSSDFSRSQTPKTPNSCTYLFSEGQFPVPFRNFSLRTDRYPGAFRCGSRGSTILPKRFTQPPFLLPKSRCQINFPSTFPLSNPLSSPDDPSSERFKYRANLLDFLSLFGAASPNVVISRDFFVSSCLSFLVRIGIPDSSKGETPMVTFFIDPSFLFTPYVISSSEFEIAPVSF